MLNQDDENENNIINTNSNNILLKDNKNISHKDTSKSLSSLNEEERKSLDSSLINHVNNIKLDDLQLGSKILCPEKNCFLNAIIMINPFFLKYIQIVVYIKKKWIFLILFKIQEFQSKIKKYVIIVKRLIKI